MDPISGLITVGSGLLLDRESSPGKPRLYTSIYTSFNFSSFKEITINVEVRDNEGTGRSSTVPVVIRLLDINDNAPQFIGLPYEVSLTPDFSRFTSKVVVQVN